ncbi:hypothetical protein ACTFIY_001219 [Dictyostelium cf. discoideum]
MKNIVNGKKVTNEEIKTIESAVNTIGGGELYSFFKISNYSNEAEITKAYNEFKKINNDDTTAMDGCYKVLSDSRLRSIYDSIYFNDLIKQNNNSQQKQPQQQQQQHYQSGNQINENNKLLLLKTLSIPLYTLSTILNANSGIINNNNNNNLLNGGIINYLIKSHKELIQLIFEKSGIVGFYRGSIFKVISYPFQKLFVNIPSSILLNQCFYKNSFIKPLIYKTISEFPSTLLSDYMILSFSTPLINQIKNLFGNNNINNSVEHSISIKSLLYSIGSSIILLTTRRLILNLIKKVEIKLIQSKIENPNSKLIKYCQIIYCNPVIQCFYTTLLINPLEVLRLQSLVSYLNFSNNLKILSPIQMVINLIKNQNSNLFGYLFNGAPTLYLYLLISNHLKKLNNNNNNNNIHSLI